MELPSRRVRFEYPDDFDPIWTPRTPEFSCAANSLSLMMPAVEDFFVKTVRTSVDYMDPEKDEQLIERTRAYVRQESQHYAQHLKFNRLFCRHYKRAKWFDEFNRNSFERLRRRASIEFALAMTAILEVVAYSAARWAADNRQELLQKADPLISTLFLWHLAEEVEHKSAAHNVYHGLFGPEGTVGPRSLRRYLIAMGLTVVSMPIYIFIGLTLLLWAEKRLFHPMTWIRLIRWVFTFMFEMIGNLSLTLARDFHPDQLSDPYWYEIWLREYDTATRSLPIWSSV